MLLQSFLHPNLYNLSSLALGFNYAVTIMLFSLGLVLQEGFANEA